MTNKMIDPQNDGVDHINIYSRGKTELGRALSNFAPTRFAHPTLGVFCSMEGFYYFISTGMKHDVLRALHGYKAKQIGSEKERVYCEDFERLMKEGLSCKIKHNPWIMDLLKSSSLPFTHYYFYGTDKVKVVFPKGNDWLVDGVTEIRDMLKKGEL